VRLQAIVYKPMRLKSKPLQFLKRLLEPKPFSKPALRFDVLVQNV
jgi:hypothetical protein